MGQGFDGLFLADRSGDEQEGRVRRLQAGDLQGGQAVELRQLEIGKDDLGLELGQGLAEVAFPFDQPGGEGDPRPPQLAFDQFGVGGGVLQDQHPQRAGVRIAFVFFIDDKRDADGRAAARSMAMEPSSCLASMVTSCRPRLFWVAGSKPGGQAGAVVLDDQFVGWGCP